MKERIINMSSIFDKTHKTNILKFIYNIEESNKTTCQNKKVSQDKTIFQEKTIGTVIDLDRLDNELITDLHTFVLSKYNKIIYPTETKK